MRPFLFAAFVLGVAAAAAAQVEERVSTGALPAHAAGVFEEIAACHLSPTGSYLVFDRRAHAVFTFARGADTPQKIVQIGSETGRIIRPTAFDSAPDGTFVVADAPGDQRRLQFFTASGAALGGFTMAGRPVPLITMGNMTLSGLGSLKYTGRSILLSQPDTGALATEYGLNGAALRAFGELRTTGQEKDRAVHEALNLGQALPVPGGGYYFVFLSGLPMFRKYDAGGKLLFERHIEGVEVDPYVSQMPRTWPKRRTEEGEIPLVPSMIRTAEVDADGNLWVSLVAPFTYVYDSSGEKRHTIQFRAAGIMAPTSFFFTADGRVLVAPGCYVFRAR
ncbi:MAG: hypothetical protein V7647_4080 [Acidobacteriota bacterium]